MPWWAWALGGVVVGAVGLYVIGWIVIVKSFEKWW